MRVKVYYHSQFEPQPAPLGTLRQPYLARSVLDLGSGVVSSDPAPKGATIAIVETDEPIHLEISPPQDPRTADDGSPVLKERGTYCIGPGWTVSARLVGATHDTGASHD